MAAPSLVHQMIAGYIYSRLIQHALEKEGRRMPVISPHDVQPGRDNKTMVQPDAVIVCGSDKIHFCNEKINYSKISDKITDKPGRFW